MRVCRAILATCLVLLAASVVARADTGAAPAHEPQVIVIAPDESPPPAADDDTAAEEPGRGSHERGLFWEVSGTDDKPIKSKVYLLGSIHVANGSLYPLPDPIQEAFASASVLAVEINLDPDRVRHVEEILSHAGTYPVGSDYSLRKALPPRCWQTVQQTAQSLGVQGMSLSLMKPWLAALTLESIEASMAGLKPEFGLDMHFLDAARKAGKEIVELEGLDDQIDMFDDMPKDQQAAMLCSTAAESKSFKAEIERMFRAWKSGDANAMAGLIDEEGRESPELRPALQALITRRNREMTEKIQAFLNDEDGETHFVVVGAAHMVGPTGIVAELQGKGYIIEQK